MGNEGEGHGIETARGFARTDFRYKAFSVGSEKT